MPKTIIGVMGPGSNPTDQDLKNAYAVGKFSAENNYTTLTGGSKAGVMNEALKGAKEHNGGTIGILAFGDKSMASDYADHIIVTAMGSARNNINVLSSDIIVACGCEAGTLSEIAMAIKANKNIILMTENNEAKSLLKNLSPNKVFIADTTKDTQNFIKELLS